VLPQLELADEPRLLSVTAVPFADVASVKGILRALPASTLGLSTPTTDSNCT
jgi:hypothetical protein